MWDSNLSARVGVIVVSTSLAFFTDASAQGQEGAELQTGTGDAGPVDETQATPEPSAAQPTSDASNQVETLVVSAHRVPLSESDVGSAVSSIERALIEDRQSIFAADLLQDVTGVAVSRLGGLGAQTQVRVRGAEANQVLVFIDGVKANDPAGSDEFDFSSLTAYDIDRLEVVRGPQSALWGSEATAGVINITTRRPDDGIDASGFVEGGSRRTLYTGGRIAAGSAMSGAALNVSYLDTRGDSAAAAGEEDDGYENLTVGLNARWQPSEWSRLSFSARYNEAEVEFDGLDFLTGLPGDADLLSRNDMLLLNGEGGVSMLDGRWDHNLRLTYLNSDRRQLDAGEWTGSTAADKLGVYYQSTLGVSDARQHLILAVDFEEETFSQRGAVLFGDPNQDQKREKLGWVAEYLAAPGAGWNLSASVRHDDNSDFADVTTYRLTAAHLFDTTDTRLRASYGTGQKAPTFVEQFGFFPELFVGNPDLKPERTRGFDVGVTQTFGADRWQIQAGYFDERLESEIVTTFVPESFLSTAQNLEGDSRRSGAELELQGRLSPWLRLLMSYTYTDSTQPDGQVEVRRPRHMAAANLHSVLLNGRAALNLNLSYTGSQTDQIFPPPFFVQQTVELDDYLLVNLAGSYSFSDRLQLYLRAENLFDEQYVNVVGYRTPGRSLHLGVRLQTGR